MRLVADASMFAVYFGALMMGLGNLKSPHLPIFLSSVASNPRNQYVRLGSALFQILIVSNIMYNVVFISTIILVWVFCLIRLILGLR